MQIPRFPEIDHPLIQALAQRSDQELLTLFKRYPERGAYFAALFCRYTPLVYTLIGHSARSPVQADYLFALTWRHIYFELGGLDLERLAPEQRSQATLQNWLINITADSINRANIPGVESIHYSLRSAPPVLWCYVQQCLDDLPPLSRLVLVLTQTFRWSTPRISAYLQAEGEKLSTREIRAQLEDAYEYLETYLPQDIREIYLAAPEVMGAADQPPALAAV
ncbi:MAG: sigma-70 family RNA polymerase sigma factor [Cyanobacteria bacterium P01_H01_bin.121]